MDVMKDLKKESLQSLIISVMFFIFIIVIEIFACCITDLWYVPFIFYTFCEIIAGISIIYNYVDYVDYVDICKHDGTQVQKEIECMKDFSINKCICQFVDEKENWLLDEVIKEIKDHPETYGDWDFYIMNREKLKELLDKGARYDYDIERGNRILNDNIKVINEFSTALSKLKCICLEFIHDYDTRVKLMDTYNVSDFVVIENLKFLVEDFKNEFERIGN